MGNDLSTKTARTLIPLDESVCWQLYNSLNERSEPISIFLSKQTYSVECRRSIQFLKTVRHPNLIKFYTGFKTFVEQDSFIADCVHPLANKLTNNEFDSTAKLTLGLYQLTQALQFLHEKALISHNNVCLSSLYISLNGIWILGNFECACRYENLNKKYLSSLKIIRAEECLTPEEDEKDTNEIHKDEIFAVDVYGLGKLIHHLMTIIHVDNSLRSLLINLEETLTNDKAQSRPKWSNLLKTELFQIDYIKATELLDRLPTINESDLSNSVDCLSTYLDNLHIDYFNELLIRRLFVPFMFLCSSTRTKIIPKILIPKTEQDQNSWINIDKYRNLVLPIVVDLFSYHVTCIRETLLEYFNSYSNLIDKTTLTNVILPQLIYGLKDSNNRICMLTLMALATLVPVLGADIVVGGQRRQIFTDTLKKDNVAFPKTSKTVSTSNSPLPTPPLTQKVRKPSPITNNQTKLLRTKPTSDINETPISKSISPPPPPPPHAPIPSEYTNGHHSSSNNSVEQPSSTTTIVENGHQIEDDFDNDNEQWSDWEQQSQSDVFTNDTPTVPLSPQSISEQAIQPKSVSLPIKSLKLNSISKPKWDPNAPLGSEFEIPPVVKKKTKSETVINDDPDDFFKDMAPKVETVELMTQLETMFNLNTDQSNEQNISKLTSSSSSSFSNKFGVMSEYQDENQEIESGNNNWDE